PVHAAVRRVAAASGTTRRLRPGPRDRHSDEQRRRRQVAARVSGWPDSAIIESSTQEPAEMPVAMDDYLRAPYSAHLDTLSQRLERALAAGRLDALCVFAGAERFPARDDVPYPFRIEPYFKAFVPLVDAPGSVLTLMPARRPRLIYLQPEDFWHAPPKD